MLEKYQRLYSIWPYQFARKYLEALAVSQVFITNFMSITTMTFRCFGVIVVFDRTRVLLNSLLVRALTLSRRFYSNSRAVLMFSHSGIMASYWFQSRNIVLMTRKQILKFTQFSVLSSWVLVDGAVGIFDLNMHGLSRSTVVLSPAQDLGERIDEQTYLIEQIV